MRQKTFEFDGQIFDTPRGYVFERVGCPQDKDVGKYILGEIRTNPELDLFYLETQDSLCGFRKVTYFIFRKAE